MTTCKINSHLFRFMSCCNGAFSHGFPVPRLVVPQPQPQPQPPSHPSPSPSPADPNGSMPWPAGMTPEIHQQCVAACDKSSACYQSKHPNMPAHDSTCVWSCATAMTQPSNQHGPWPCLIQKALSPSDANFDSQCMNVLQNCYKQ